MVLILSAARYGWVWVVVVDVTVPGTERDWFTVSDADATPTAASDMAATPAPVISLVVIFRIVFPPGVSMWSKSLPDIRNHSEIGKCRGSTDRRAARLIPVSADWG